jgi:hypothetical protein
MPKQHVTNIAPNPSRRDTAHAEPPRPMMSFFPPDMALTPQEHRLNTEMLRSIARLATFPMLCRQMNGGCFRARRCRGDAGECVGRFINLLPPDARDFIDAALEGQRAGRPFEDLVEEYPDEFEALQEWRAALALAFGDAP